MRSRTVSLHDLDRSERFLPVHVGLGLLWLALVSLMAWRDVGSPIPPACLAALEFYFVGMSVGSRAYAKALAAEVNDGEASPVPQDRGGSIVND